ncbi:MAG: nucleotidyltransferase family protein [Proteobacteria bacterium]|nr:nucleotidyltransferase family protein [Pseudomonadota bacterium]MBI3495879.1 nucleotidyltransferase family protein [Pseudomonadota bacterium]
MRCSRDGIDRFRIPCTCVGIHVSSEHSHEVYAPYGLAEFYAGLPRPNTINDQGALFQVKAASYRARGSWLTVTSG